jgi:hypothetical protein
MLNKRLITQLSGKMAPALRVAPAKSQETWLPLSVTRYSFGHVLSELAKLRASCLDWQPELLPGRRNSNDSNSVNRP